MYNFRHHYIMLKNSKTDNNPVSYTHLDLSKTYRVATNNYVISDEDYPEIVGTPTLYEYGTCEEALIAFIKTGQFEAAAQQASLIDITGKQTNSDTDKQESNPRCV